MITRTTRKDEYTESTTRCLYLSFELGAREWKLGFTVDLATKPRIRVIPARDLPRLRREIAETRRWCGVPASVPVSSCYEAGREGFWLHRTLTAEGIANVVVDSASIEVNRRRRRAKSDRLDVAKLLAMLVRYRAGEQKVWSVVRVPTIEEEDRRHLHRELRTLRHERTAVLNRISGLLANHGCRLPARWHRRRQALDPTLMTAGDGAGLPPGLCARLQREWAHAQFLAQQVRALEQERDQALTAARDHAATRVRQLLHLRALGANSAWILVHEFFGWRHFRNGKEVGAAAGLTPTPFQSGDDAREQGISKAGNRHIRAAAIELAWGWLRYQPTSHLTRWYLARFAHAGPRARKIGIVAVARKLLIALWHFLEHGVLPEGAHLKAV